MGERAVLVSKVLTYSDIATDVVRWASRNGVQGGDAMSSWCLTKCTIYCLAWLASEHPCYAELLDSFLDSQTAADELHALALQGRQGHPAEGAGKGPDLSSRLPP